MAPRNMNVNNEGSDVSRGFPPIVLLLLAKDVKAARTNVMVESLFWTVGVMEDLTWYTVCSDACSIHLHASGGTHHKPLLQLRLRSDFIAIKNKIQDPCFVCTKLQSLY